MIPPVVVHCGVGALLSVLSVPLILRKVPMNWAYGVRVRKAFTSESNWYAINAYGGKLLLAYGLVLIAFGLLAQDSAPPPTSIWTAAFVAGPLVLIFPIVGLIAAYARRLP
jgi:uncharacterized membrane protein